MPAGVWGIVPRCSNAYRLQMGLATGLERRWGKYAAAGIYALRNNGGLG